MRLRRTPGETRRVVARNVVVLAPHYDDEVLGCSGLISGLTAASADVVVLFLTDGSGGEEQVGDPPAYARRRRREADAAIETLGAEARYLELPDGALEHRHEELMAAYRDALLDLRPDLLLVPSPLEVTADHRAAFFALHALLSPLRQGDDLEEAARGIRVLVYELNHPAYPDLLVDVSDRVDAIREAMACYASQEERHGYLEAGLGLRRYRTHSLGPEIEAVEAYSELELNDFVTRSATQLVEFLGGLAVRVEIASGPVVSIVVRTKDRPELLREALDSLARSLYRPLEIVLVNDGGAPVEAPADYPLSVVAIDLPENRGRAAAANAGVEAAGGELIGFLDDDDLATPEHVATLVAGATAADVRVVYSDAAVGVYEMLANEGWVCRDRRLPYSRDFDADLLVLDNYMPFNTLLIPAPLFAEVGPFDEELTFFEDWDFLIRLARRVPFHHIPQVTCEYRHFVGSGHHILAGSNDRRSGPVDEFLLMKAKVIEKHAELVTPDLLAGTVDRLRAEQVKLGEEVRGLRRSYARLEDDHVRLAADRSRLEIDKRSLEDRYHRLNGEVVSLRQEMTVLQGDKERLERQRDSADQELQRLYEEEQRLGEEGQRLREEIKARQETQEEQASHLGSTYAEIERLGQLIRGMERSRAWRLHQLWRRRFRSS